MTDAIDPASLIEAAQGAAASGDFPTAERLLRDAIVIQEAALGSDHPDLATTLNNLAFACERTNNIADAERNYRRAHAIAVASLGPRHPFVATSVRNLVDFCAAHDIPIWKPPAATSEVDTYSAEPEVTPEPEISEREVTQAESDAEWEVDFPQEPAHALSWPTPRVIGLAGVAVVVIVAVAITMRSRETAAPINASAPASTTAAVTSKTQPTAAVDTKPDATPARVERPAPPAKAERPAPREKTVTSQPVTVLNAQLCKSLVKRGAPDWQCTITKVRLRQGYGETGLEPGTYIFYTRLLTSASTTVEHRWLHDGRSYLVKRLRVSANPNGGYRTYSSNSISAERAGEWKVELRAADGTVLKEERFVIR